MLILIAGCDQPHMANQDKYETYEAAPGWPHDQSARLPVPGTVARDEPVGPRPDHLPMPLTRALLERGQERYQIYCTPCHGHAGYGHGVIVHHRFPQPPSYHIPRLRDKPLSYFYDVITDGYGIMYSYAARVRPHDRWAIAAYIRALQRSQHARPEDLTPAQRSRLGSQAQPPWRPPERAP